ncbi:MAG: hypothetical protein ACRD3J_08390, partial [Thermoanaerobaculia bacterium]
MTSLANLVAVSAIIAGITPALSASAVVRHADARIAETAPATIVARGNYLVEARRRIKAGDPSLMPAYRQLIKSADNALRIAPISVMQKSKVPPSGD